MVVYILYNSSIERYYVGQTQNIEERLAYHNAGFGKYTKKGVPWKLIWKQKCEDRSTALKLERKIKKRGASRFLDNQLGV